jgi:pyruvate-formate lyase-activating enzyme
MIKTFSMCPSCYKRIPAAISIKDGAAIMRKTCPAHGKFSAVVDPDGSMVLRQYNQGSLGLNKALLIPVTDKCDMSCPWCYMKGVKTEENSAEYYDSRYFDLKQAGFAILLSGGEPTCREDFIPLVAKLQKLGWTVVTMSNMINFADANFMKQCGLIYNKLLLADFSMQHPKNYTEAILASKMQCLKNLGNLGLQANCIQFSVSDLDELPWIRTFYDETKHLYRNIRIRSLHGFWKDKSKKIYLSALYKAFIENFGDLMPMHDMRLESTNIYSIYMRDAHCGISLSSAPTVNNVDLSSCSRPTYGVALDEKYYGFPVAQIVSEGIQKGWYNGYKLQ